MTKIKTKNKKSIFGTIATFVGWMVVIYILVNVACCVFTDPTKCNSKQAVGLAQEIAAKVVDGYCLELDRSQCVQISNFKYLSGKEGQCSAEVSFSNGRQAEFRYTTELNANNELVVRGTF